MDINRDELKKALEIVKPGLASNEIIEQSTSFAFLNGSIVTYNDEISIAHPIEGLDITGAVYAAELYKFLGKTTSETVSLTIQENELIVKSGRATSGFALAGEVSLPLDEELNEKGKWKTIPENFLFYLKFASMSCSSDLSDPKLTCVHVNSEGFIESTDNFRITHCKLEKLPVKTFLIPGNSVSVVVKNKPTKMAEGKGWIHFKTDAGTVISCRTFNDVFVNTSSYLKLNEGIKLTFPQKMNDVLDRALVFAQRKQLIDETITISVNKKRILVESQSATSWFKESLSNVYKGDDFSFNLTPSLLKDILAQSAECTIDKKIMYFKSENWIYLTMLRA